MPTNCAILFLWDTLCKEDNSTCQLAGVSIQSTENAMTLLAQGFYTLSGVCEMADFPATTEIIERCHKGLQWTTSEGINEQYPFLEEMLQSFGQHVQRNRRFAISGPIAIAIAIGLFSGTGAVAASVAIAREEGRRISKEQNLLRNIDSQVALTNNLKNNGISRELGRNADYQKYISALSAETVVNYHNAEELKHQIIFMVDKSEVLTFRDPATEQWRTAIKSKIEK